MIPVLPTGLSKQAELTKLGVGGFQLNSPCYFWGFHWKQLCMESGCKLLAYHKNLKQLQSCERWVDTKRNGVNGADSAPFCTMHKYSCGV